VSRRITRQKLSVPAAAIKCTIDDGSGTVASAV
jgi:hypothetical protein